MSQGRPPHAVPRVSRRLEASPTDLVQGLVDELRAGPPAAPLLGLELAARRDLLPGSLCHLLLQLEEAPAAPIGAVRRFVEEQTERPALEIFAQLDEAPWLVRWPWQWHRGRTPAGEDLELQVLQPDVAASLDEAFTMARGLAAHLARWRIDGRTARRWSRDLPRQIRRFLDLARDDHELARLAGREGIDVVPSWLVPPTPHLRIVRRRPATAPTHPKARARRLARTWLTCVLEHGCFPSDPRWPLVCTPSSDRVEILGGGLVTLNDGERSKLRRYLETVNLHQPRTTAEALAELCDGGSASIRSLEYRLRQVVPLRESGLLDPAAEGLATLVLAQLRAASLEDFRLEPAYHGVAAGLARLEIACRSLTAEHDAVDTAWSRLGSERLLRKIGRQLDPRPLPDSSRALAGAWLDLPVLLDRALDRPRDPQAASARGSASERGWIAVAVLLALACSLTTIDLATPSPEPFFVRVFASLLVILGLPLLWLAAGLGRR